MSTTRIAELVPQNRSYRRFRQEQPVPYPLLQELVALTCYCPSAANLQPLRYMISATPEDNARIFPYLSWAGYLQEWPGPAEGQRPAAYILILGDRQVTENVGCDHGIAAQTMLLEACAQGYGGCIIGAIQKEGLRRELNLDARYRILLALALGQPDEQVTIEPLPADGSIRYWRDAQDGHHVPKRGLDELLLPFPPS